MTGVILQVSPFVLLFIAGWQMKSDPWMALAAAYVAGIAVGTNLTDLAQRCLGLP